MCEVLMDGRVKCASVYKMQITDEAYILKDTPDYCLLMLELTYRQYTLSAMA